MQKITYLEETTDNCKVNIVCKCGKSYTTTVKAGESLRCKCGTVYKAFYTGWIVSESALENETGNVFDLDSPENDDNMPF